MKDDLLRRLRQKVVRTDNNGQSYFASRNIDGDEAADEIERLIAELAAERENARNKLMDAAYWQERAEHAEAACDELRALFREEKVLNPTNFYAADRLRVRIDAALNKGGGDE